MVLVPLAGLGIAAGTLQLKMSDRVIPTGILVVTFDWLFSTAQKLRSGDVTGMMVVVVYTL
ncbi:hypothetical protein [Sodalis-like endosymbiont of Proechinophthirus fluctus]|uniref:hypothetical protein n=1 Tax=Sodalis-like endosymbiont of Proechinophthirus fluctus TaxID=1462730 RepID=UPI003F7544DD